jgi:hypothetical protein
MKLNIKATFLAGITMLSGVFVLLGYFLPIIVGEWSAKLLRWAVILTAILLIVGVINLARTHAYKISHRQPKWGYSIVMLVSLALTFVIALFLKPTSSGSMFIFDYILTPVEASLMAILAVILAYTCVRLLSRRLNVFSILFVGSVLLVLVGTASIPVLETPLLRELRDFFITQTTAVGGARGILLGVSLGTIATALRLLMGADRPYGG